MVYTDNRLVLGTTLNFSANFSDSNGNIFTPDTPVVVLSYPTANGRLSSTTSLSLNVSSNTYTAEIDTRDMSKGTLFYTTTSGTTEPIICEAGFIVLLSNPSNPNA